MALVLTAAAAPPAAAQAVEGWRLHETPHFLIYVVDGTPGARDLDRVATELERIHRMIVAPLGLPPTRLIYPLYPSVDRFRADWWRFATQGHGDFIHAWGAVYAGDLRAISPYLMARAVVDGALPRLTRMLRWGVGEALGDRASGVDSHAHLAALLAPGAAPPAVAAMLPPWEFGQALPLSYPTAVSFVSFLIDRYGLERTWAFVERVNYRYYDLVELFGVHFREPLAGVEPLWRARVAAARPAAPIDLEAYRAASGFVYTVTLAGNPGRRMLRPDGAVMVSEAFAAIAPLRALDLDAVRRAADRAGQAAAQTARQARRRNLLVRSLIYTLVLTPIVLSAGVLLWPILRARRRAATRRVVRG